MNCTKIPMTDCAAKSAKRPASTSRSLGVAGTWFGSIHDDRSADARASITSPTSASGDVVLSDEHTDYRWATREEVAAAPSHTLDEKLTATLPSICCEAFDLLRAPARATKDC